MFRAWRRRSSSPGASVRIAIPTAGQRANRRNSAPTSPPPDNRATSSTPNRLANSHSRSVGLSTAAANGASCQTASNAACSADASRRPSASSPTESALHPQDPMFSVEDQMIALNRQAADAKHSRDGRGGRQKADLVLVDVGGSRSPKAGFGNPSFGRLAGGSRPTGQRIASTQGRGVGRFGSVEDRLGLVGPNGLGRIPNGMDPAAGFGRLSEIELNVGAELRTIGRRGLRDRRAGHVRMGSLSALGQRHCVECFAEKPAGE